MQGKLLCQFVNSNWLISGEELQNRTRLAQGKRLLHDCQFCRRDLERAIWYAQFHPFSLWMRNKSNNKETSQFDTFMNKRLRITFHRSMWTYCSSSSKIFHAINWFSFLAPRKRPINKSVHCGFCSWVPERLIKNKPYSSLCCAQTQAWHIKVKAFKKYYNYFILTTPHKGFFSDNLQILKEIKST